MKSYYIGVDIGGTNTKVGLIGQRFGIIDKISLPTASYKDSTRLFSAIAASVRGLLKARRIRLKDVAGVGIGVAGLVDAKRGVVHSLVNIRGWKRTNVKRWFERELGLVSYVDNDVNLMALAEFHKGAGRGCRNLVCITLGTGLGGGLVINGKLYRGSTSFAGEIGHVPINEKGPRCNCGGMGCIEAYVGNRYVKKELARGLKGDPTPESAYRASCRGDRFALRFWKRMGCRIGVMLAGVVNLLNPDMIVVGGGTAEAGRFLFAPMRSTLRERAMQAQGRSVKIVKAALGSDAALVGAALLVKTEKR